MPERGEMPYTEIHKESFRHAKFPLEGEPGGHIERAREEEGMVTFRGHGPEEFAAYIEKVQGPEAREAFGMVTAFATAVKEAGGTALQVGGSVRDEVLGRPSKDFDVEVYGLTPEQIKDVAGRFGSIDVVGKSFGVLKLTGDTGMGLDISCPRRDSKVGEGHKGFDVELDPNMSVKEAARRRDFTFNALAKDPLTGEILDAFGGVRDLRARTLRVTDTERFRDDALRVLRGAQFVGRFGLRVDPESMALMRDMVPEMKKLSRERIREEWDKLLLKSVRPSMGLQMLLDAGVIDELYPELLALDKTPQEFEWHPEGTVWVHTLMGTDAAADVVRERGMTGEGARVTMYGALCHDTGKPATTTFDEDRIRSLGHEPAGEAPTRALLERLGASKDTVEAVVRVVREHLWPSTAYMQSLKGLSPKDGAVRRLARRLVPATIEMLTCVAEADHRGRGPYLDPSHKEQFLLPDPYVAGRWLRERAERIGVYREAPKPLLQGRDLVNLGFAPGKSYGEIINLGEELRNEKGWTREKLFEVIQTGKTAEAVIDELRSAMSEQDV